MKFEHYIMIETHSEVAVQAIKVMMAHYHLLYEETGDESARKTYNELLEISAKIHKLGYFAKEFAYSERDKLIEK